MGILQVNNSFPQIFHNKSFVKKLRIYVHSDAKGISFETDTGFAARCSNINRANGGDQDTVLYLSIVA